MATATPDDAQGAGGYLHDADESFDYIIVGSGPGGGPLAANLAHAGKVVLLLEAGLDTENAHYQVPVFHGHASEDAEYAWEFFVRHYTNDARQRADSKYDEAHDGIFYPRSGTLGGCSAHNAMITIYPNERDWNLIADLTGDESWRSDRMRMYFERLERCRYRDPPRTLPGNALVSAILPRIPWISRWFSRATRHGYNGWLTTRWAPPELVLGDSQLVDVLVSAARAALATDLAHELKAVEDFVMDGPKAYLDPNDWGVHAQDREGLWLVPVAVDDSGHRNGTREYLRKTRDSFPENLTIRTGCLATRVAFDGNRAVGVEYLESPHLYATDPRSDTATTAPLRLARARREVILSGGAFNSPQLLKLSGVGPREELERFGIGVVVDLPGVGEGLQDRYEVGVVSRLNRDLALLAGATFDAPVPGEPVDPYFEQWQHGKGVYTTNGALLGITKRSVPERDIPDLFVFGLPAKFRGYYPGYSNDLEQHHDFFTWAILKAHTENTSGTVRLRSNDPRQAPEVNFRYFDEGNDIEGTDLESVVEGVLFARRLMSHASGCVAEEIVPGPDVRTRDEIRDFVRREAWGHHASCSCKIGSAADPQSVLDSRFRVRGTRGLRVVDASVFPRIPGFFIASAVYMISEKATDAILADARAGVA